MARLEVEITGDSRSLERAFNRSSKSAKSFQAEITRTGRSIGSSFAAAAGISLGVAGAVAGIKSVVNASSNLAESLSKNQAVFKDSAGIIEGWSQTTARAFGVSQREAVETASTFGALFGPLGIIGRGAAEQSRHLTELGADLASFYNTDVTSALDALRSGLVGEAEPLRRYGVLLSETRVQEEALRETHKKHVTDLTVQEKALARLELIYRDTAVAQGDFGRTSEGLAGQQKILAAQIDDLKAKIGDELRPEIVKVLKATNAWLGEPGNREKVINDTRSAVEGLAAAYQDLAAAIQAVKDLQGTRSDLKDTLGPFGFLLAGPKETFNMFKKSNEGLLEALGMDSGRGRGRGLADLAITSSTMFDQLRRFSGDDTGRQTSLLTGPLGDAAAAGKRTPIDLSFLDKTNAFVNKWLAVGRRAATAAKAKAAADKAAEQYQTRMETKQGWLEFGLERAEATKRIRDDRVWLRKIEVYWKERIKHEGRKLELVSELWRTQQRLRELGKKSTKSGDPLAGLMQVSSKRLANMLAAGTGLNAAGRRVLGANIAGAEIRPIHNHLYVDGREVASSVNRHNARGGHRTGNQTSGRVGP